MEQELVGVVSTPLCHGSVQVFFSSCVIFWLCYTVFARFDFTDAWGVNRGPRLLFSSHRDCIFLGTRKTWYSVSNISSHLDLCYGSVLHLYRRHTRPSFLMKSKFTRSIHVMFMWNPHIFLFSVDPRRISATITFRKAARGSTLDPSHVILQTSN